MHRDTVRALNFLNRKFYRERAEEFSLTRQRPWRGWSELFGRMHPERPPRRVLDIGCGNARLYAFLTDRYPPPREPIEYCGVDASPLGLELAAPLQENDDRLLLEIDLIESPERFAEIPGRFDAVVLFGVMHHIPGRANRERLLREAASRLAPGGWLAFTRWRFAEHERFRNRIVDWSAFPAGEPGPPQVDSDSLEPGDYLLRWGDHDPSLRYCHAMEAREADDLIAGLPLDPIHRFLADGKTSDLNDYIVLQSEGAAP